MKKKFLSVLLIVAVLIGMAGVSGTQTELGEQKADKEQKQQENEQTAETKVEIPPENEEEQKGWIGVILNGDETEPIHWHILTESGRQQKMSVFRSRISSGKSVSVRMMAAKVR